MLKGFKEFIMRGNVLELAIGTAFTTVVKTSSTTWSRR
jgi:large-conductance mechanosensitive channel